MLGVAASLVLAAVVVVADQAAKRRVVARLAVGRAVALAGPARLRHVVNRRGGLVALPLVGAWALWAGVTVVALWAVADPALTTVATVAVGLVVGGGAGNLVDRSTRDGVVDFIAVGRWPTFNLADVALSVGAALVVVALAMGS